MKITSRTNLHFPWVRGNVDKSNSSISPSPCFKNLGCITLNPLKTRAELVKTNIGFTEKQCPDRTKLGNSRHDKDDSSIFPVLISTFLSQPDETTYRHPRDCKPRHSGPLLRITSCLFDCQNRLMIRDPAYRSRQEMKTIPMFQKSYIIHSKRRIYVS
jgi:hypothetical protein